MKLGTRRFKKVELRALAEEYCTSYGTDHARREHCNRHDRERWIREFREVVSVANDLLMGGERGRALSVLCHVLTLDDALSLIDRPKTIADYCDITISSGGEVTLENGIDTLRRSMFNWFMNTDVGIFG